MGAEEKLTLEGLPTLSGGRVFNPGSLDRVVILGMGSSITGWMGVNYEMPNKRDEKTQVWTINSGCLVFDHDVVFNMHDLNVLAKIEPEKDFRKIYEKHDKPVVTVALWEGAPRDRVLEYPLARVISTFNQHYFATGISYMIACAMLAGVKDIWIFGADFNYADGTGYERGRANVEYWLGLATAMGIRVTAPNNTTLLDTVYREKNGKGAMGFGAVYGYFDRQPIIDRFPDGLKVVGFENVGEDFASLENEIEGSAAAEVDENAEERSRDDPGRQAGEENQVEDRRDYPH